MKMKKALLTSLLLAMVMTGPAWGQEAAHHTGSEQPPVASTDTANVDATMMQMRQVREKMMQAASPSEQKKIMQDHMKMMKKCMAMMDMMDGMKGMSAGGMGMGMMGKKGMKSAMMGGSSMSMQDRIAMMEKKIAMMDSMMRQGGMMGGSGMMNNCMMTVDMTQRMQMMEKKMAMMKEMMKSMMAQQEMMMK